MSKILNPNLQHDASTLCQFLQNEGPSRFEEVNSVLEIGPGKNPVAPFLFEQAKITSIDLYGLPKKNDFIQGDYLTHQFERQFNLIIDGHVFHTLACEKKCRSYLKKIYKDLSTNGFFVMETMVSHSKMTFEEDYLFYNSTNHIMSKNSQATRAIFSTHQIEQYLIECGFILHFFSCPIGLKMIPHDARELAKSSDPDVLRVICQKSA